MHNALIPHRWYAVSLLALGVCCGYAEARFRPVTIDAQVGIGYGLTVADMDGDHKLDLVLVDRDLVAWYRNPDWSKQVIARKLTDHDHVCVAATDLDSDGKAEVAVGAGWNPGDTVNSGALFYLQPASDRTQLWTPIPLPHEPVVHRIRWGRGPDGRLALLSVPLHGHGNNPQTGEGAGVRILRYLPPMTPGGSWSTQLVSDTLHKTHNFDVTQWDDDPASELLVASKEGVFLIDWTAVGDPPKLTRLATNTVGGAGEVRAGRLNHSRRFVATVEPMHGNTLAVYVESPVASGPAEWQRRVLDESLLEGHALACGDLLALGRDQIVVGWRGSGGQPPKPVGLKLFTPSDENGWDWSPLLVDDNGMACEDLVVADLDGDNRLDIAAAGRATRNLKIYFNESTR